VRAKLLLLFEILMRNTGIDLSTINGSQSDQIEQQLFS